MSDVRKATLTVKVETTCYSVSEALRHAPAIIEAIEKAGPDTSAARGQNVVKSVAVNK